MKTIRALRLSQVRILLPPPKVLRGESHPHRQSSKTSGVRRLNFLTSIPWSPIIPLMANLAVDSQPDPSIPSQTISSSSPHHNFPKAVLIGIFLFLIFVVIDYWYAQNYLVVPPQTATLKTQQPVQTPATPSAESWVTGDIKWLDQPVKIPQTGALLVFPTTVPPPSTKENVSSWSITALPVFYKVGTWLGGAYEGSDVIAIQYTFPSMTSTNDYHTIKYASVKDSKAVLFDTSPDPEQVKPYIDSKAQIDDLTIDPKTLPGLLSSIGNSYFPVTYQGAQMTLFINPTGEFFTGGGYTFLTTFSNGQKLYRKNQSGTSIPWSNLENPYSGEDFDHSQLSVDSEVEGGNLLNTRNKSSADWIVKPDLLTDIVPDSRSLDDVWYSTLFGIGCKFIPVATLSKATVFNPADLNLL